MDVSTMQVVASLDCRAVANTSAPFPMCLIVNWQLGYVPFGHFSLALSASLSNLCHRQAGNWGTAPGLSETSLFVVSVCSPTNV